MFFGLTNSPATFQALMNSIFTDLIAKGVVAVYLDDILIYTKTIKKHCEITREVLRRLEENDLLQLFASRDCRPVVRSRGMACAALRVATRLLCAWRDSYG
jgi:hypothetical protein